MSKTARGIYHNLEDSEYTVTVNGTVYFFSSLLYMAKFEHELESNREKLEKSLRKQNLQFLYCDELADYQLYVTIEKRGFYLEKEEIKQEKVTGGLKLINKRVDFSNKSLSHIIRIINKNVKESE